MGVLWALSGTGGFCRLWGKRVDDFTSGFRGKGSRMFVWVRWFSGCVTSGLVFDRIGEDGMWFLRVVLGPLNHEEDVEMSFLRARTPRIGKY